MLRFGSILLGILICLTPAASAKTAYWALYDGPCENPGFEAEAKFQAGTFGYFYVASSEFPPCLDLGVTPAASGNETLLFYPSPGPAPISGLDCPSSMDCGIQLEDAVPPYLVIADWNNWHGRSMQSMAKRSSAPDIETVLLEFECVLPPCHGVNDLTLLALLAKLAEAIDHEGVPLPVGISMSFGRLQQTDDALNTVCQPSSLSCQIALLLEHLIRPVPNAPPRILVTAAAGNHRTPLFPASLDSVLSVGSLDLRSFALNGKVKASWETPTLPELPDALMPGTALCLEMSSNGRDIQTPGPAGSSFSASLFGGWIADIFLKRPDEVLEHLDIGGGLWAPYRSCSGSSCPFLLTHQGLTFSSSAGNASDRIYEAFENDPANCGDVQGVTLIAELDSVAPNDDPRLRKSLVQAMSEFHLPAPGANPCVPCVCCQVFHSSVDSPDPSTKARSVTRTVPFDTEIDLHSGWKLPPKVKLLGLFLLLGQDFKQLHFSSADALEQIAAGKVAYLRIMGTIELAQADEQPSLLSLLEMDIPGLDEPQEIWDATQLIWPLTSPLGQP